jgi:UV DNA damage repair endonuclease
MNTKLWIPKMSTKVHLTSSESHNQRERIANYIYISTVMWLMSQVPCKYYLRGREKEKNTFKQVRGSWRKVALHLKKYM